MPISMPTRNLPVITIHKLEEHIVTIIAIIPKIFPIINQRREPEYNTIVTNKMYRRYIIYSESKVMVLRK